MKKLSEEGKKHIADAVAGAEAGTRCEILVAVIPESDNYALQELLCALVFGCISFFVLAAFASELSQFIAQFFWTEVPSILPLGIFGISTIITTLIYLLVQIPALDRLVIGKKAMARAVEIRAQRQFIESKARLMASNSVLLFFVSCLERRVEIISDKDISKICPNEDWEAIIKDFRDRMKKNTGPSAMVDSIVYTIADIGTILSQRLPLEPGTKKNNELSDDLSELAKGS